jgi:signal transduction histidine kinase
MVRSLDPVHTSNRRVLDIAAMLGALGCLTGVTVWGQYGQRLFALDLAIGLLSWVLLPLLPVRPVVTTILLDMLAIVSPAATPAATAGTLQVAQRRGFRTAMTVALVGIAAHAARGALRRTPGLPYFWWVVLIAIAHAALVGWGAWSKARGELIESLRERADRAEAEQGRRIAEARAMERTRIAREMHDVLAHRLSLIATYAGALEYRPDAPPEKLAQAAGVIRSGAHQALAELRDVLLVLRADETDDYAQGTQPVLADLPHLLEEARDAGTPVELTDRTVAAAALPATLSRTAYRVVQEGLTNARKHAPSRPVLVTLEGAPGGRLTIELRNPVQGTTIIPGSGTGLIGLTERVRLAGGRAEHRTAGEEFLLEVWLPFPV